MRKFSFVILTLILFQNFYSQNGIKVKFIDEIGFIDKKYYEVERIETILNDNLEGPINQALTYPQAYRFLLNTDKSIPFRKGFYFMDETTSSIKIDTLFNTCYTYDYTDLNAEYRFKYLPFIYKEDFKQCNNIIERLYFNNENEDVRLQKYIIENPHSYVALWHLIERVSFHGFTDLRKTALTNFSNDIKKSRIWKLLKNDLERLEKYALGSVLPKMSVKDIKLNEKTVEFSKQKSKYTLVEFWFSRCSPCLKAFEKLVPLNKEYHNKGFNVITISTDKTKEVSLWLKTIDKYRLDWTNFLDEEGMLAEEMNISSFPSNFLLDEAGRIIKIDISVSELELFLAQSL